MQGTVYERRLANYFVEAGYAVVRSAASLGPADLVVCSASGVRFVQVKATASWLRFTSRQMQHELREAIRLLHTLPDVPHSTRELWVYVARAGWMYILVDDAPRDEAPSLTSGRRMDMAHWLAAQEWIKPGKLVLPKAATVPAATRKVVHAPAATPAVRKRRHS